MHQGALAVPHLFPIAQHMAQPPSSSLGLLPEEVQHHSSRE